MICSLPLIMVTVFLIFTLIVGLYYSKKTITLKEYAIGHKNFNTTTLVATVLATACGGATLVGNVQEVYYQGLYWIILRLFFETLSIWILSLLAIRMTPFMHNLSIAETIGQIYGNIPRVIVAISSICSAIAILAIQVNVIAQAMNLCMHDMNPNTLSIIATVIVIFYSTFGGIQAVTITDVFQFVTFIIIIPYLAWFIFQKNDQSFMGILTTLYSYEKFTFSSLFQCNKKLIAMLLLGLTTLVDYLSPSITQRIYMSSNVLQGRKVFLLSSIAYVPIAIFVLLIGVFVFVNRPDLSKSDIWNYITIDLTPFLKGVFAISLLAMTMSTADSRLNVCSVLIVHDIIGVIRHKHMCTSHQLSWTRITSFTVGGLAMLLAFHRKDLLDLLKLSFAFFIPITTAPLLLAIYGFRSSSRTALIGMATGIITILVWQKYLPDIDGAFPAMLANGMAMLLAHYSLPKGKGNSWEKPSLEYQQLQQVRQ